MKVASALALTMAALGIAVAVWIPISVYRSGTTVLPAWRTIVGPGPLSKAHAFLEGECEVCHTPNRGITAPACMVCHASDAPVLAKQSTVFHAQVRECRGCHIEHRGADARPTQMDHSVLVRIGWGRASASGVARADDRLSEIRHFFAQLTERHPSGETAALDCQNCHEYRDRHRGLFGRACADCHDTVTWQIAQYQHPSPRSQDCAQCHQAPPSHFMMHFAMVSMAVAGQMHARVEQCFLCHQTDSWNDIKGVGWYKHH